MSNTENTPVLEESEAPKAATDHCDGCDSPNVKGLMHYDRGVPVLFVCDSCRR